MKYLSKIPFIRIWANFFVFTGKETFKEYLIDFLLYLLFAIGLVIGENFYFSQKWHPELLLIIVIFLTYYLLIFPLFSMTSRRLYTVGTSANFCTLLLIPIGGLIWALVVCLGARSEEEAVGKSRETRVRRPMKLAGVITPISSVGFLFGLLIVAILIDSLTPPTVRNSIEDYQIIFNIADTFKIGTRKVFGFGEYKYNSYLLLVPKETPSTLEKFYYRWNGGMDVDDYGFYFECKLEKEKFDNYVNGLDNFDIKVGEKTNKLIKTEGVFEFPTYVAQWENVGPKWQVFEYIMLDTDENKVIYAFSMSTGYEEIIKNASYNIAPKNGVDNVPKEMNEFSIYKDAEEDSHYQLDEMVYDVSFLSNLL